MARQRYTITESDRPRAAGYIANRLHDDSYWLSAGGNPPEATETFQTAKSDRVTLNAWCEAWLSTDQWTSLKNALRAARKRDKGRSGKSAPPVHVTLSREAWQVLSDLAKRDKVTLSEWLVRRYRDEWAES